MQDTQTPAAIYCRISKDREGAGLGVQRQEQDGRELAASLGWSITRVYTDNDISAYSGKPRPAYREMLDAMQRGHIRGVISWHTDRLHRSPRELEEYIDISEQRGVITHTVKAGEIDLSTPSGRAVARTLGAWARYESEHKSERGKRKQLQLAQDGKFTGGPVPYGWEMVDKVPVIVEADAAEIRTAVSSIIAGASIGSIVRDLNARGIKTRRGQVWTSTSVRNLVMRPTNAGQASYLGEIMGDSIFPPIVTVDQWRTATAIVKDPSRRSAFDSKVKHLLAGMLRCGTCEKAMQTSSRARDAGPNRHYYKCRTQGDGHAFQTARPVEELISAVTVAMLEKQHVSGKMPMPGDTEKLARLQEQALTLRGRLDESANSYADGAITAKQLEAITARVRSQLDETDASMAQLGHGSPLPGPEVANIGEWWAAAGIERQRAIIDTLMTVYVDPIRKSAPRTFDPERIRIEWKTA